MTAPETDQVVIERDDERVRCGRALFTPFLNELTVQFLDDESETVKYDLRSIPFNQACRLHDGSGKPTRYLLCRQWNVLHVRYGDSNGGPRLAALTATRLPRTVRLADDLLRSPRYSSSAMHPTRACRFWYGFCTTASQST